VTFVLSEEQEELRKVVRAFFAATSPPAAVRRLMETPDGYDAGAWRRMAGELGLPALAIPEADGGMGFGLVELGLVFEEAGRALAGGPLLASAAMATGAVLASAAGGADGGDGDGEGGAGDGDGGRDLLAALARGDRIGTLAVAEDRGRWDRAGVATTAAGHPGGARLHGHKSWVLDGLTADLILVAAADGLYAVDGDAPGLTRTPIPTLDLTRKLARLVFDGAPARRVGGWPAVEAGLAWAAVALANEQVGGAQRCLEMAVAYAKERTQFGRPIGSFQAIKHKCADLLREIESARSTAAYANWAATQPDHGELLVAASLAKAACSGAYLHAASECIQIHGALGFTWEHDAHLYFKRAKSSSLLFGDPTHHRTRLADLLGL